MPFKRPCLRQVKPSINAKVGVLNRSLTHAMKKSASPLPRSHQILERQVTQSRLAGVSAMVLKDGKKVDEFCYGYADLERHETLRPDHLHRAFSNSKLVTAVLTLMLHDEGHFALDDPIKKWIPEFGKTRVLRTNAQAISDTESLASDITIRHLLSHQSGLSHGVFDPGTMLYKAYHDSGVRKSDTTLEQMVIALAALPLRTQPGTAWEYSMSPDVLARLIELVTKQRFSEALASRLFNPLGMRDTAHVLALENVPRLTALYRGVDDMQPTLPGLRRIDNVPWPNAFITPVPREAGSTGLVTSQADMVALLTALTRGALLKAETFKEMLNDQLPLESTVRFDNLGPYPSLGFGLAGAITRAHSDLQPNTPIGEMQWGGLGGTHWSYAPSEGIINVLMSQRYMGFWNPFWFEYKQSVYEALCKTSR
jgi:CubicO group peptidase (beta-lactamase class C family)